MEIFLTCAGIALILLALGVAVYFISKSGITRSESPLETMLNAPIQHTTWETKTFYEPIDKTAKPVDIEGWKNLEDSLNLLKTSPSGTKKDFKKTAKQDKNTEKLKDLNKNLGFNLD